jgi:uncharacterized protein (DUF952 family)
MIVFHITEGEAWDRAQQTGEYEAESLATEGFIHCSTEPQLARTAERFYRGRSGLVLLAIETDRLRAPLRWEGADGDLFPHIYGPLNTDAVLAMSPMRARADGTFEY